MRATHKLSLVILTLVLTVSGCSSSGVAIVGPANASLTLTRIAAAAAKLWPAWSPLDHDCFHVDLQTLRVYHRMRLFWIPGGNHPYPVDFGYYSDLDYDGPYGRRWRTSLDARLIPQPSGDVDYLDPHGVRHVFRDDGSGGFISPVGCCVLLEAILGGYRLTNAQRWIKIFDDTGLWTGLERPDGQLIQFTREADHRLTRVDTPEGRVFTFVYASHLRLERVTDFAGRDYGLGYDSGGRLTRMERPLRAGDATPSAYRYTYDGADLLRTIANGEGQSYGTVTYNGSGQVTTIATSNGTATYTDAGGSIQARARDGSDWEFFLKAGGQLTRMDDPGGGTTTYDYDGPGRRSEVVHPSGKRVTYTYSASLDPREFCNKIGSRTEPSDFPATPARVTQYEFLAGTDQWTRQVKPDGTATDWAYDAQGNRTSMTMPAVRTTTGLERGVWEYTYDTLGRATERRSPTGALTTYEYGDGTAVPTDLLVREIRDAGAGDDPKTGLPFRNETVSYEYDAAGNRTRVTYPDNSFQTITFDTWDNFTTVTDEAGGIAQFNYDAEGRLVRTERPHRDHNDNPIGTGIAYREFTFDVFGQPLTLRNHDGFATRLTTYAYGNGSYRPARITDPNGVTDYTYDFNGRQTSRTVAPGTLDAATTTWTYDNNRLTGTSDPLGNESTYTYDGFGQRSTRTDPEGATSLYSYDVCGRRVATTIRNALGADLERTRIEYDGAGSIAAIEMDRITPDQTERIEKFYDLRGFLAEEWLPGGRIRRICADGLGQIVREEELPLDRVTEYDWDARRRLVEKRDIRGGGAPARTMFEYDAVGNLTRTTDPIGRITDFEYDTGGNPSRMVTPGGRITDYVWDAGEKLRSGTHTDGATTLTETYNYDATGRLTSETTNGLTKSYTYDAPGRMRTVAAGGQTLTTYDYDLAGNLVRRIDPGGTIDYEYDKVGRLLRKVAGNQQQTYAYDGLGRLTSGTDRAENGTEVTILRTWDGYGNMLTDTQNGMGVVKTYETGLKPKTLQTPNMSYTYEYDTAQRVASIDRDGRRYMDYSYDAGGYKIKTRDHPDSGLTTEFEYDALGRSTRVNTTTPGGVDADFTNTHNALGLVESQSRADGSLAERFEYDPLGRLLSRKQTVAGNDRTTTYRFQPNSDRFASIADTRDGSDDAITYDNLGRIVQAGSSVLTYGPGLDATNMFDNRPAYQPSLIQGATAPSRVEYRVVHDRWGRVSEVYQASSNDLVACFYYDVLNRPIVAQELEFNGAQLLARNRVFDGCKLVYEFSPVGQPGFDLFYVPDPATGSHLASGFDDSFFSENLWHVDTQWIPRQLSNVSTGNLQERYDDFTAQGTPHFEFPGVGDHFRGAPSLQSLVNAASLASSYACGIQWSWSGPVGDPFLPRPLPYVPKGPPGLDGFPRVGPGNPPVPGPFAPPLPRGEENNRDCSDARLAVQAAIDKMQTICTSLQGKQIEIDEANERLDEANDRINGALRDLRDALSDIAEFNKSVGRIKFAQNVDTALSLVTGAGALAKSGLRAAGRASNIGAKVTNASSRTARAINASRQLAAVNGTVVSDASLAVIEAGLNGLLKEGAGADLSISGFLLAYGQLLMGVEIESVAADLKAQAYRAFVDLKLAKNERGRALKHLNGLLDCKQDLLDQGAAAFDCFKDTLRATRPWWSEVSDLRSNGFETQLCFGAYGGK